MTMRMRDDKLDRLLVVLRQPLADHRLHGVEHRHVAGAGVLHQHFVLAEKQVDERPFEIRALGLPQNVRVGVVAMDLNQRLRLGHAGGRAVNPRIREDAGHSAGLAPRANHQQQVLNIDKAIVVHVGRMFGLRPPPAAHKQQVLDIYLTVIGSVAHAIALVIRTCRRRQWRDEQEAAHKERRNYSDLQLHAEMLLRGCAIQF